VTHTPGDTLSTPGRAATEPHIPPGEVRHERRDIQPMQVFKALAFVVAITMVVVAVLYPVFLSFRARQRRTDPPPPPMGQHQPGRRPAEPRLQTTPVKDLAAIQAGDQRRLNGYGWVDEPSGTVHIPISEAMRLLVARGAGALAPPAGAAAASPSAPSPAAPGEAPGPTPAPAGGRQ
jgi:hypothetical protein